MIDTICCVLLGFMMEFFAYKNLTSPETVLEQILGVPPVQHRESVLLHHFIAIIGGMSGCLGLVLMMLGFFQPSSNARHFALGSFAMLQYLNIKAHYNYPVKEAGPPESMMEMPLPLLMGMMGIALIGVIFGKTDGHRRQILRSRKKVELYAKHASAKAAKVD